MQHTHTHAQVCVALLVSVGYLYLICVHRFAFVRLCVHSCASLIIQIKLRSKASRTQWCCWPLIGCFVDDVRHLVGEGRQWRLVWATSYQHFSTYNIYDGPVFIVAQHFNSNCWLDSQHIQVHVCVCLCTFMAEQRVQLDGCRNFEILHAKCSELQKNLIARSKFIDGNASQATTDTHTYNQTCILSVLVATVQQFAKFVEHKDWNQHVILLILP